MPRMTTETRKQAVKRLEDACFRFLARREYSHKELGDRLARAGYDRVLVQEVLEDLKAKGLQSDRRYAQQLSDRRVHQGYGPLRLAAELRERGVDSREVVWPSPEDCEAALRLIYEKRFGVLRPEKPEEWAARERFLLRRGFSRADICRYMKRLPKSDDP